MGAVLRFIAWVLTKALKYGLGKVKAVAAWARENWQTVAKWIEQGVAWGTILEWILKLLGLN
jgi:hypothetical protein